MAEKVNPGPSTGSASGRKEGTGSLPPMAGPKGGSAKGGRSKKGKITSSVHDRNEEYAFVTQSDLRDVADFGLIEYVLAQTGGFFFSGALWEAISILAEQKKFEFTAWLSMCCVSMAFGIILSIVGFMMFRMRQRKVKKHFPREGDD